MLSGDDAVNTLRRAIRISPDNVPLRQHLADTLLSQGRAEEAEEEYRLALALWPEDQTLKLGLATSFYQQGKNSQALVVVEHLIANPSAPPRAFLLHARLLQASDRQQAALQYRKAVEYDPSIADPDLAKRLGIKPGSAPRASDSSDFAVEGRLRAAWQEPAAAPDVPLERPRISFQDVGGMEALKEEIRMKIIHPLAHADLYRAYGKAIGGGILMYGPPGCGKTHLARATAGEIQAAFISVGIHDVLEMWIGNSERNLHELFEVARVYQPSVLFVDEVDALGASRADMRHSGGRHLINQFLAELDGVQSSNEGILVLAATNAPWHVDAAFWRPGRFDRVIFVPPPDAPARAAILRILCRGKPVDEIDFEQIARKTDGFSGADLRAVVDLAVEGKLREAMSTGMPKPLSTRDLAAASSSARPTTRDWFATARNYAIYSNQGGIYDDILKYLKL